MLIPARCQPCTSATPRLSQSEIDSLLNQLRGWEQVQDHIARSLTFANFRKALAWTNRVGMLAEEEGHHPDFHLTGWNHLKLVLSTHAVGGLTLNDFALAKKIDDLARSDGIG